MSVCTFISEYKKYAGKKVNLEKLSPLDFKIENLIEVLGEVAAFYDPIIEKIDEDPSSQVLFLIELIDASSDIHDLQDVATILLSYCSSLMDVDEFNSLLC
jgi:hypothetical protein